MYLTPSGQARVWVRIQMWDLYMSSLLWRIHAVALTSIRRCGMLGCQILLVAFSYLPLDCRPLINFTDCCDHRELCSFCRTCLSQFKAFQGKNYIYCIWATFWSRIQVYEARTVKYFGASARLTRVYKVYIFSDILDVIYSVAPSVCPGIINISADRRFLSYRVDGVVDWQSDIRRHSWSC